MKKIQRQIELVKTDILQRFPNCSYTIGILLWDDGTSLVECRHGNDEGTKIYKSTYYNNELIFDEIDIEGKVMIKDMFGNEKFQYLTDEKPKNSLEKKMRAVAACSCDNGIIDCPGCKDEDENNKREHTLDNLNYLP